MNKENRTLKNKASRRSFLRRSAMAGSGLALLDSASAEQSAPPNDTIRTLQSLRTIHGNFLDKPLPEPALKAILQSSIRTANASNAQTYSIIVVKDRAMMKNVCGYQGGGMLLYCADFNRLKASAEALGHPYDPGTIESFVVAAISASVAAQTAVIAAKSLGIDSLLTNGIHRGNMDRLWKLLDLPQTHCFPVIALVLGYPAQEPAHRTGRLDGAGVIHDGKYHRLTSEEVDEITRKYDDKQQHLGLNETWDAKGYKHYLDWYFKEWASGFAKPPQQETQMLRKLRTCGFIEAPKA